MIENGIYHVMRPGYGYGSYVVHNGVRYAFPSTEEANRLFKNYVEEGKELPADRVPEIDALPAGEWKDYLRARMLAVVIPLALVIGAWMYFRD